MSLMRDGGRGDVPRTEMAKTPGRFMLRAKLAKGASESPRPWKRMRMAVVDSGGEGKCSVRGKVGRIGVKSASVGIRGGILAVFVRYIVLSWLWLMEDGRLWLCDM